MTRLHGVTKTQAQKVLAAVKRQYKAYISAGAADPVLIEYDGAWAVAWDEGPYEWAIAGITDDFWDAELASYRDEFPNLDPVIKHNPNAVPPGVFTEAINSYMLGIYEG